MNASASWSPLYAPLVSDSQFAADGISTVQPDRSRVQLLGHRDTLGYHPAPAIHRSFTRITTGVRTATRVGIKQPDPSRPNDKTPIDDHWCRLPKYVAHICKTRPNRMRFSTPTHWPGTESVYNHDHQNDAQQPKAGGAEQTRYHKAGRSRRRKAGSVRPPTTGAQDHLHGDLALPTTRAASFAPSLI